MIIDLYCNDGSPLNVIPADIYGRGVGGAELAMLSWAETMGRRGHTVNVFNRTDMITVAPLADCNLIFRPQRDYRLVAGQADVFIAYRSPNPYLKDNKSPVKIHWSMDQYTIGNFASDVFPYVDQVVCISPFHRDYHMDRYGIEPERITWLDLGVRLQDYDGTKIEKIKGRCIFCSVPDRGLHILRPLWNRIVEAVSYATLVITGDYRLWGAATAGNGQHKVSWLSAKNYAFLGKVSREDMVKEQLAAVCMPYPCVYEELFCLAVAEAQVAGAKAITPDTGALATTNVTGLLPSDNGKLDNAWCNQFVEMVVETLRADVIESPDHQEICRERFSWERICDEWERVLSGEIVLNG